MQTTITTKTPEQMAVEIKLYSYKVYNHFAHQVSADSLSVTKALIGSNCCSPYFHQNKSRHDYKVYLALRAFHGK